MVTKHTCFPSLRSVVQTPDLMWERCLPILGSSSLNSAESCPTGIMIIVFCFFCLVHLESVGLWMEFKCYKNTIRIRGIVLIKIPCISVLLFVPFFILFFRISLELQTLQKR